jgi:hypothetical protein
MMIRSEGVVIYTFVYNGDLLISLMDSRLYDQSSNANFFKGPAEFATTTPFSPGWTLSRSCAYNWWRFGFEYNSTRRQIVVVFPVFP